MKYKTYSIGEISKLTGYAKITLRNWAKQRKIPSFRTVGNHLRFTDEVFSYITPKKIELEDRKVVGYCRVSSKKQEDDLLRQIKMVQSYIIATGEQFEIITDIGSGINYLKPGIKKLLNLIVNRKISKIVILHKDRLFRFANELIEEMAEMFGCKIEVIDQTEKSEQQELVEDLVQIITVFSCKLNGKRSHQAKKMIKQLKDENNSEN